MRKVTTGEVNITNKLPYPLESSSPLHALENSGGKNFRAVTDVRGISISTNGIVSVLLKKTVDTMVYTYSL